MDLKSFPLIEGEKKKKTAIVIGASSSIGKDLAPRLINEYDILILTEYKNEYPKLQDWAHTLKKCGAPADIRCMEVDVRKKEEIDCLGDKVEEMGLEISALIYLAGINVLLPAFQWDKELWNEILNVNLTGFFFSAQRVAKNVSQIKNIITQKKDVLHIA